MCIKRKKEKKRVLAGWHSIGVVPIYHNWVIKKANGKIFQLSTQKHKGIICKWPVHISGHIIILRNMNASDEGGKMALKHLAKLSRYNVSGHPVNIMPLYK